MGWLYIRIIMFAATAKRNNMVHVEIQRIDITATDTTDSIMALKDHKRMNIFSIAAYLCGTPLNLICSATLLIHPCPFSMTDRIPLFYLITVTILGHRCGVVNSVLA